MKTNTQKRLEALARLLDTLHPEPVDITITVHPGKNALHTDEIRYKIESGEYDEIKRELNIQKIILLEEEENE